MARKQLIFTVIVFVVFLAGVLFLFRKKIFKKKNKELDMGGAGEVPADMPIFPLKKGSQGKEVEQMQLWLAKNRSATFPKFGMDGKFGAETLSQVEKYLGVKEVPEKMFKDNRMQDFKTKNFK